jgi:hypothetical protein
MKNVTTNAGVESAFRTMILATAVLSFSMTTVFAQDMKLKAEVPFAFHIGNQEYAAGTYETSVIGTNTGVKILKIVNVATGSPRLVMATTNVYPRNAASRESGARLVFRCAASNCALSQIWSGGEMGMQFRTPAAKSGEPMHLAVIRLRPTSAD